MASPRKQREDILYRRRYTTVEFGEGFIGGARKEGGGFGKLIKDILNGQFPVRLLKSELCFGAFSPTFTQIRILIKLKLIFSFFLNKRI